MSEWDQSNKRAEMVLHVGDKKTSCHGGGADATAVGNDGIHEERYGRNEKRYDRKDYRNEKVKSQVDTK